jgi:predicted TIM-barrel fold metal-dependent hydrolase
MLSRRDVLAGGLAAGLSQLLGRVRPAFAAPMPVTKVNFDIPPGSCDCAVHVFGDPKRYPLWSGRTYTPDVATLDDLRRVLQWLHLDRVVVVQATIYGADNSCALDSVRALNNRARGVTMIDEKTSEASLDEMHRAGFRGIRLNFGGTPDPGAVRRQLQQTVERARPRNWHIQFTAPAATVEALREDLAALPVTLVLDHFAGISATRGTGQPGFATAVNLVKSGKAYIKISNAPAISTQPDLSDMTPYAKAFVAANPQRVIWGSAWPHPGSQPGRKPTDLSPNRQIDDGKAINMLPLWAPDAATRRMILVENPARLYGF